MIALIVYNGSVLAEVLRAGVESLPRGQREAGYAIGLRKAGVMRLILLPQAIRAMMPVIISQLVVTLKDTALGFIITYPELLYLRPQPRLERRPRVAAHPRALDRRRHLHRAVSRAVVCGVRRGEAACGARRRSIAGPAAAADATTDTELIVAQQAIRRIENDDAGGS